MHVASFLLLLLLLVATSSVACNSMSSQAESASVSSATARPLRYAGGDVSMLPELERRGAVYCDPTGRPVDAIAYFRLRGWNLFRIRLFVDPSKDFDRNWGATQDLAEARALARRVRDAGGDVFLCLHYSDTWADPKHQAKPAAWAHLSFDALERRVYDYTAEVLAALRADGVTPAIVQVGNEVTAGMLWPDGQVAGGAAPDEVDASFARLARLLRAGARAVREASTPGQPIRVAIHAHGGGHRGVPTWFFDRLAPHALDFDAIALSVYPSWDDDLGVFAEQAVALATRHRKDVLVAETAYPHAPGDRVGPSMRWPQSPAGQVDFIAALRDAVQQLPQGRGLGVVWWYPEALALPAHDIYKSGREGVFDRTGTALPAIDAIGGLR